MNRERIAKANGANPRDRRQREAIMDIQKGESLDECGQPVVRGNIPGQHLCTCISVPTQLDHYEIIPQRQAGPGRCDFGCSNLAAFNYTSAFFPNLQDPGNPDQAWLLKITLTTEAQSTWSFAEPPCLIPCQPCLPGKYWPPIRQANYVGACIGLARQFISICLTPPKSREYNQHRLLLCGPASRHGPSPLPNTGSTFSSRICSPPNR